MKSIAIQGKNLDRSVEALRRNPLFRGLGDDQVRSAAEQAQLLLLEPGEELVGQGETSAGIIVVCSGELRVLQSSGPSSEPHELARFAPFEAVDIAGALLGRPSPAAISATAPSTVIRLDSGLIERLAGQAPAFGLELARALAERLERAVGRLPIPEADAALVAQGGLLDLLPRDLMVRLRAVPLAQSGQSLTLGLADEPSPEMLERVRAHLPGMELRPVRLTARQFDQLLAGGVGATGQGAEPGATDPALLDRLLRAMVAEGASDLHLSGGQRPRWRHRPSLQGSSRPLSVNAEEETLNIKT